MRRIYSIPLVDAIIGATALKIDAKLVTRNIRHFERIENLKIVVPYWNRYTWRRVRIFKKKPEKCFLSELSKNLSNRT